ncbi:hypothetical protein EXIGLDRAFT_776270 [Exidia glandulosa HHB12029]|uniref:Uncharacterized protein n=1 Tax=Exidia glandulosa HHB12029 TaxID=1314781 RepID=A0A165DJF5_EXIGL|nr:hypothetical protein EXIGLDRAFT_776270 [Exidia glandulosa HHB12029]
MAVFSKMAVTPCSVGDCPCVCWEPAGPDTLNCKRCNHWDQFHIAVAEVDAEGNVKPSDGPSDEPPPLPSSTHLAATGINIAASGVANGSASAGPTPPSTAKVNGIFARAVAASSAPTPGAGTQRSTSGSSSGSSAQSRSHTLAPEDYMKAAKAESLQDYRPKGKAKVDSKDQAKKMKSTSKTHVFKRIMMLTSGIQGVPVGPNGLPAYASHNIKLPSLAAIKDMSSFGTAYEPAEGKLFLLEGGSAAEVAAFVERCLPAPMKYLRDNYGGEAIHWRLLSLNNNSKSLQILGGPPPNVQDVVDATKAAAGKLRDIYLISTNAIPEAVVGNWDMSYSSSSPSRASSPSDMEQDAREDVSLSGPVFSQPGMQSFKRVAEEIFSGAQKRRRLSSSGAYVPTTGLFSGLASGSNSNSTANPPLPDGPSALQVRASRVQAFSVGKALRQYTSTYEPSSPVVPRLSLPSA